MLILLPEQFAERLIKKLESTPGLVRIIQSREGFEQYLVSDYVNWMHETGQSSIHDFSYETKIGIPDSDESIVVDLSWNDGNSILNVYSWSTYMSYDNMDPNALTIAKTVSQIEDKVSTLASTHAKNANLIVLLLFRDENTTLFNQYSIQLERFVSGLGNEKGCDINMADHDVELFSEVMPAIPTVPAKLLYFTMEKREVGNRIVETKPKDTESNGSVKESLIDSQLIQRASNYGKWDKINQLGVNDIQHSLFLEICESKTELEKTRELLQRLQIEQESLRASVEIFKNEKESLQKQLSELSKIVDINRDIALGKYDQKTAFYNKTVQNLKPIKLRTNTYRECLREIRDELLAKNETIKVSELADRFEKRVIQKYEQQCLQQLRSEPNETLKSTIEELTEGMLSAFKSGGGGARYAQIHLYCVNSHLRKYYRKPLELNPKRDSKTDFNFFAFPYIDKEDKELKFNDKRIKAFNLEDPELKHVEVFAINDGDEDYTKVRVTDIKKGKHLDKSAAIGVTTKKKRGRKPKLEEIATKKADSKTLAKNSDGKGKRGKTKETKPSSVKIIPTAAVSTSDYNAISLSDKIWIAVAQLHRDNPEAEYFKNAQIIQKMADLFYESDVNQVDAGANVLISAHLVAEEPKKGVRRRYLASAGRAKRRLFKDGDVTDPSREGAETHPQDYEIGKQFKGLIDWYNDWSRN